MEDKIKSIIKELNEASAAYYNGREEMSNVEWDALFDKLKALEEDTGIIFPDSPTQKVGALPKTGTKVTHEYAARSLDKTKDISQMASKMSGEKELILMWKLDGGTLQLTYSGGRLKIAATRGNGEVGQNITANAASIGGIPLEIPFKGDLTLRGEALMSYEDFNGVNAALSDDEQYANPRNLANATVSMLDPDEVKKRRITLKVFSLVQKSDEQIELFDGRMKWLQNQGFDTVDYERINSGDLEETIESWSKRVETYPYPVDGLVVSSNDIGRCERLPGTGHHPNVLAGYAFKWADTEVETVLREIEWSPSRTGLLNPVAIFDSVELEGTTVSRASLHNVSYIRDKHLRIGDAISVYKANMIIPQVRDNLSENTNPFTDEEVESFVPVCPVCGTKAVIKEANDIETMHCPNKDCMAKSIGRFVHFCSRDCMDIGGLSEATISKFVEKGFLKKLDDFYELDKHKEEIIEMEGFGKLSWKNLWEAISESKNRDIISFITSLGIPNVGKGQARLIALHFSGKSGEILDKIFDTEHLYDFTVIDGIGDVINESIHKYAKDRKFLGNLLEIISVSDVEIKTNSDSKISGKTFVVTGSVEHFANRNELKEKIESLGGKVTGSVTSKTDYLINNDITSNSGKNKKAKELNVEIITEEIFLLMCE